MKNIQILIADDMEAHRRRLERIIHSEPSFSLVGLATSGAEAVSFAIEKNPDIILMDIEMEDKMAGITAAAEINEKMPNAKIIMLTVHKDDNIIFAAFQTGIVDYVIKSASVQEITDAINAAVTDSSPIRPLIAGKIREEFARIKQMEGNFLSVFKIISTLSPAELEVLSLLCHGKTRKEIAENRSVELDTIKQQINSILRKFNKKRTKEIIQMMNDLEVFDMINNML